MISLCYRPTHYSHPIMCAHFFVAQRDNNYSRDYSTTHLQCRPMQSKSRLAKTWPNSHSLYGHDTSLCTHCYGYPIVERSCRDCPTPDNRQMGGNRWTWHSSCARRTSSSGRSCSSPTFWWCHSRQLSRRSRRSWWIVRIRRASDVHRVTIFDRDDWNFQAKVWSLFIVADREWMQSAAMKSHIGAQQRGREKKRERKLVTRIAQKSFFLVVKEQRALNFHQKAASEPKQLTTLPTPFHSTAQSQFFDQITVFTFKFFFSCLLRENTSHLARLFITSLSGNLQLDRVDLLSHFFSRSELSWTFQQLYYSNKKKTHLNRFVISYREKIH